MTPRKSSQDELSKDSILDVARDLFVSKGYEAISMRKIATILKCSHGAIYYHFKNKAEIFYEIISTDFKKLDKVLDQVIHDEQTSNDKKLFMILFGFIQFGLTHQNQYEVMFLLRDDDIKGYIQEGPNKSYQRFAEAVYSLNPTPLTTKEIWSLFMGLHGFVTHYIRSESTFEDVKDLAASHVHFLLKAIK